MEKEQKGEGVMTEEQKKAIKKEAIRSWIALIVSILCLIPQILLFFLTR